MTNITPNSHAILIKRNEEFKNEILLTADEIYKNLIEYDFYEFIQNGIEYAVIKDTYAGISQFNFIARAHGNNEADHISNFYDFDEFVLLLAWELNGH